MSLSTEAFSGALDRRASALGFQLAMLLITLAVSQLLYLGLYLEAARGRRAAIGCGR